MKYFFNFLDKIYSTTISVKFAVLTISLIAIVSAVGTVYESLYDTEMAQELVYHSWTMYLLLGFLCFTLVGVIVDRYPWKRHHLGFILAHVGIILTLVGSYVTRQFGIDGSMTFQLNKSEKRVLLPGKEVNVYGSLAGSRLKRISTNKANFLPSPPSDSDPFVVKAGKYTFEVLEYQHFTDRETKIKRSKFVNDGPAIRFQIEGSRAQFTQWIRATKSKPFEEMILGPAKIVLSQFQGLGRGYQYRGGNVILLRPNFEDENSIYYEIYSDSKKGLAKKGKAKVGDVFPTGWMDFKFRIINYYAHSFVDVKYVKRDRPGKFSSSAIRFKYDGKDYWMGLNASRTFFDKDRALAIAFEQKSLFLNFDIKLDEFRVGRYQGTMRASSYESDVVVEGKKYNISMNEPLKYRGFTFYQASFQEDEMGRPTASILSVNKDPGRWMKYLGSLLIIIGSTILFYFRKMLAKKRSINA